MHLDVVLWAAHRHLGLSRAQLLEGIRNLCCDGRCVPWGHTGPGRKRLDPFFEGHAWLAERRCSIYKANTGTTDNESRLREIYSKWIELVERLKRETDHVRCVFKPSFPLFPTAIARLADSTPALPSTRQNVYLSKSPRHRTAVQFCQGACRSSIVCAYHIRHRKTGGPNACLPT